MSWNVGNAVPPVDISDLFLPDQDIYVVGCQECEYKVPIGFNSVEHHWFSLVQSTVEKINSSTPYAVLASRSLWQMRLIVIIKAIHAPHISHIHIDTEATGIAHVVSNKGGILVFFELHDTIFTFISSHLNAHMKNTERRNNDYSEIVSGTRGHILGEAEITSSDHLIWFGDLNYRIEGPERDSVVKLISKKQFPVLLGYDQLIKQMAQHNVFVNFKEMKPHFNPTYRYNRGSRTYETEKMRVPSWTDRILHLSNIPDGIKQIDFKAIDSIMTSDHSPVSGTFKMKVNLHATLTQEELHQNILNNRVLICPCIIFDYFHCEDIRIGDVSSSDPFLVFYGRFLEEPLQSKVIKRTLKPKWQSSLIPVLPCLISDVNYLQLRSLLVLLYDYDTVGSNDFLGQIVLPLAVPFETIDTPHVFQGFITYSGIHKGTYECKLSAKLVPWNQVEDTLAQGFSHSPYLHKSKRDRRFSRSRGLKTERIQPQQLAEYVALHQHSPIVNTSVSRTSTCQSTSTHFSDSE